MKKIRLCLCSVGILLLIPPARVTAQQFEIQQLMLNVEKLAQLKSILQQMYDGYEIISKGYNTVKNISEGNFNLHEVFLDGLLQGQSPMFRKYRRVADIIQYQTQIVKEYQSAYSHFKNDKNFRPVEIEYMANVYKNLFNQSVNNLDELLMIMTAGNLRMSDDERIKAIDKVFTSIEEQLAFLRHFNSNAYVISLQRTKEKQEIELSRMIFGIK